MALMVLMVMMVLMVLLYTQNKALPIPLTNTKPHHITIYTTSPPHRGTI